MENKKYVTVSAKIPRELKDLMDKYSIKPGPIIRKPLEEEVRRRVLEELEGELKELSTVEISDEEIARLIREDRDNL
ncbi:hypothetical protein BFU36_13015 [Sulfolobus sp. A20]|uniref:hypothetical protein n=1 Tax=Sulfolobaceae TaxID=118883 RepID=UPI000846217A|nr:MULTISPECIES: hypothetical protein [unclassified Sulfolobus]TRM78084.1 hypothetical protein DJ532_02410 [Sulfolobus sp. A20-N-F8]TRM78806.1 hypothetical protein DJ528_04180 [Sulfolobus sp. B5]TRM83018.1 hypothetical protein DJ531_07310 [Sulfolobus sp. A20-N-F6]TRM86545.1 hypothetical protein DJ529_11055 [Sulfolobus sp. C3]TRM88043.1 hypothetical protein DJ521_02620 [Sulfolobus sp. E3]TRM94777.1 hypothetical protein DJ526_01740 [Sulfolobus sp. A20-N-G8]TRM99139.1 hypothetical protein DJ527